MALCRFALEVRGEHTPWGWVQDGRVYTVNALDVISCFGSLDSEIQRRIPDPARSLQDIAERATKAPQYYSYAEMDVSPAEGKRPALLAPIRSRQEVWAAGVTYESSKFARMAESEEGGDFYARVYVADRPELFFKATPNRVVGPNDAVRIRADSKWNVPEPELAALIAANGRILGYTVGNDMSSRDIEGANPLYLPQAKVYRGSCALGPVIVPAESVDPQNLPITLTITRGGETAFRGETNTARMKRTIAELRDWLFRENEFPHGVFLLTGTGIIPPDDFTLQPGDEIAIEIGCIGVLRNTVAV